MSRHTGQTLSKSDPHTDELHSAVLKQQNKRPIHEILRFQNTQYQQQDGINLLLNTAKQFKYHYFAVEQRPLLSLPDKASQVSRTALLSYLIKNDGAQLTNGSIFFICDPLTNVYISLIYDTLFNPL